MSAEQPFPPTEGQVLSYAAPGEARNGMAVAALVLGILGLMMCPIVGLVGLILGIVALVRAGNMAPRYPGRGMAIAGICCGGASLLIAPLLVAIMLPSLSRAREITKRAVCASNLRSIGQGMKVYSNDNLDWYPTSPFQEPAEDAAAGTTAVAFIGQLSANMTQPGSAGDTQVHPSRSLFLLVADGTCTAAQYSCPSSGDTADDLRNLRGGREVAAQPGIDRFDFRGYTYLSYGYQLPYGRLGRPNENLDARTVIMADKGPFFQAGAAVNNGERVPDAAKGAPGTPINIQGGASEQQLLALPGNTWRPYNSANHGGEGQNVLYQDGHVVMERRPVVGVNFDNIYTQQGGYGPIDALLGRQPADFRGPLTNTDSIMIP